MGRASNGAYLSNFERFEQIINVVVDSINQSGLAAGEDLFVGFECDTERIYVSLNYVLLQIFLLYVFFELILTNS